MAETHRATITIVRGSGGSATRRSTASNQAEISIPALSCAANTVTEIGFAAAMADIKSILIFADGACTLKTNSGVTGDDEFALTDANYVFWNELNLAPLPFTADITSLFADAPVGDPVVITILALVDVTP